MADVPDELEADGVEKFAASYHDLLDSIADLVRHPG